MKTKMNRGNVLIGIMLLGLLCFLFFNFTTTWETMQVLLGDTTSVLLFAVAISLVDFAGIARIFTPEDDLRKENAFVLIMLFVWLVAAFADILLTWWWAALMMEQTNAASHLPSGFGNTMLVVFPWAIAFMEFAIRVPLVLMVGQYGERLFRSKALSRVPSQRPTPTQVPSSFQRSLELSKAKKNK